MVRTWLWCSPCRGHQSPCNWAACSDWRPAEWRPGPARYGPAPHCRPAAQCPAASAWCRRCGGHRPGASGRARRPVAGRASSRCWLWRRRPSDPDTPPVCTRWRWDRRWRSVAASCTTLAAHGGGRRPSVPAGRRGASSAASSIVPASGAAVRVAFVAAVRRAVRCRTPGRAGADSAGGAAAEPAAGPAAVAAASAASWSGSGSWQDWRRSGGGWASWPASSWTAVHWGDRRWLPANCCSRPVRSAVAAVPLRRLLRRRRPAAAAAGGASTWRWCSSSYLEVTIFVLLPILLLISRLLRSLLFFISLVTQ